MKKKWSFNKFPKSLKKVLNHAGYCYDIKVKDFLKEVKKNNQTILKIEYGFQHTFDQYRDLFDEDLEQIVIRKTSEYPKFINWVGSHLFGDNMGGFNNIYENENSEGKWEILLENPNYKECTIEVYLIPIGFTLDDSTGKSSKIKIKEPITYGDANAKYFEKLEKDFKESLCNSIAVAGIENIIGKSGSDIWLILEEDEPNGYDYESERHYEVIERATNLLSNNLLKSLNDDFNFFKKQIEGTLGCDSFWLNFCDFQQTNDINEFNEMLQKILEEVT